MRWFMAVCLLVFLATDVRAQLRWEARTLEFAPSASDAQVVAEYSFTNPTDHAISVKSIKTSCDCTKASADAATAYAPGASGKVTVVYTLGQDQGAVEKKVVVVTDDPSESTVVLTLKVALPEVYTASAKYVYWTPGRERRPQVVKIEMPEARPMELRSASSSSEAFGVRLSETEAGRAYELIIEPPPLGSGTVAAEVRVRTGHDEGAWRELKFLAAAIDVEGPTATQPSP